MDQAQNLRNIIKKQNQQSGIARVITVTSGKGGVGKTSISVNLAILLSKMGKRVILLDADFGLANIEIMLGIRPEYSLADLFIKGKSIVEIITQGPEGIGFISGGNGIQELTNLTKDQILYLNQKLFELDKLADFIIIDTGAGISDSVLDFVSASSEVFLVATPEPTSITDAYALLKTLNRRTEFVADETTIKVISNRVNSFNEGKELYNKLSVVVGKFLSIQLEFLGSIPKDPNVSKAVIQQNPCSLLYPNSASSKAIFDIAASIYDGQQNVEPKRKGMAGLFSNFLKIKFKE